MEQTIDTCLDVSFYLLHDYIKIHSRELIFWDGPKRLHIVWFHLWNIWKGKILETEDGCRGLGTGIGWSGMELGMITKGQQEKSSGCWSCSASWLWWCVHIKVYRTGHAHTQMSGSQTGDIWSLVNRNNVSILVDVLLHCHFAKCYDYWDLCYILDGCAITSIKISIKGNNNINGL